MVQKYQSPVRVYKYPFEMVMAVSVGSLFACHFDILFLLVKPTQVSIHKSHCFQNRCFWYGASKVVHDSVVVIEIRHILQLVNTFC